MNFVQKVGKYCFIVSLCLIIKLAILIENHGFLKQVSPTKNLKTVLKDKMREVSGKFVFQKAISGVFLGLLIKFYPLEMG